MVRIVSHAVSLGSTEHKRTCTAAGIQVDGELDKARELFEQAWAARRDDLDASIAAHFVARHQPTARDTLDWNERALHHATLLPSNLAAPLLPSLLLNLAESYRLNGRLAEAGDLARRGLQHHARLPDDGYAQFVRLGLERLLERITADR